MQRAAGGVLRHVEASSRRGQAGHGALPASAQLQGRSSAPAQLPGGAGISQALRSTDRIRIPQSYLVQREDHSPAYCIADTDDLATPEVHTAAGYTCFRLRRDGGYSDAEIAAFATRFRALAEERDVYVYFRHQDEPNGALNATALLAGLGG
jgi:hypothetical protein